MRRALVGIALLAVACTGKPEHDGRDSVPLTSESEQPLTLTLAQLQRDFLASMADPARDPSRFLMRNVTILDHTRLDAPAGVHRAVRPSLASGYLQLLATRMPQEQLNAMRFEVLKQADSAYAVFSFPESALPTATTWLKQGEDWKVWLVQLNVPAQAVDAARSLNRQLLQN